MVLAATCRKQSAPSRRHGAFAGNLVRSDAGDRASSESQEFQSTQAGPPTCTLQDARAQRPLGSPCGANGRVLALGPRIDSIETLKPFLQLREEMFDRSPVLGLNRTSGQGGHQLADSVAPKVFSRRVRTGLGECMRRILFDARVPAPCRLAILTRRPVCRSVRELLKGTLRSFPSLVYSGRRLRPPSGLK